MKKIVLINGLIAGLIVSVIMIATRPLVGKETMRHDGGVMIDYASMVIAFTAIFIGIKRYRDRVLNGVISFLQAFKVGIMIALVASLIYAVAWDIYYRTVQSDFTHRYTEQYLRTMEHNGASAEEIASMRGQMEDFNEMYENPFIRFGITLMDILPVGLIITTLSAALLSRKR